MAWIAYGHSGYDQDQAKMLERYKGVALKPETMLASN